MPPSVSAKTFFENIRILRYYELLFQVFLTETLFLFRSGSASLAACETVTDVPCDIQDYEYHNTEFSFRTCSWKAWVASFYLNYWEIRNAIKEKCSSLVELTFQSDGYP